MTKFIEVTDTTNYPFQKISINIDNIKIFKGMYHGSGTKSKIELNQLIVYVSESYDELKKLIGITNV